MEVIGYDCLKLILLNCNQNDLLNWRRVSKDFKTIIDNLSFPNIDIYTAFKFRYYLIIDRLKNTYFNTSNALLNACNNGDILLVKYLISKGAKVKMSTLKECCKNGYVELFKFLYPLCKNKFFPIFEACYSGNEELINLLFEYGCNNYDAALCGASRGGHLNLVQKFILNAINIHHALIEACIGGHLDVVEFMTSKTTLLISAAINEAAFYGHLNIVKYMSKYFYNLNEVLNIACTRGHLNIVKYLLEELKIPITIDLSIGCCSGNMELIKYILTKSPKNNKNQFLYTFLSKNLECVKFLYNIYKNQLTLNDLNFALEDACKTGNIEIVKFLLSLNANNYDAAFISACQYGYLDIVKLFYPYIKNITNGFQLACQCNNINVVKFLIKDIKIEEMEELFYHAVTNEYIEIVELFLNSGIKPSTNVIETAQNLQLTDIIKIFYDKGFI